MRETLILERTEGEQDRRITETVLREQRAHLRMIYDNTSDALALHTWEPREAAWRLASFNRATMDMARALGMVTTGQVVEIARVGDEQHRHRARQYRCGSCWRPLPS